jgi:DNA-binding GntR family transcriptional regulator
MTANQTQGSLTAEPRGQEVYNLILAELTSLAIEPGQRVAVDVLSRRYETSQTPVREALSRLAAEGLVVKTHLRGYRATDPLTPLEFQHLFEIRSVLEPLAARQAAANRSESDLAELREIDQLMVRSRKPDQAGEFAALDARFHDVIARAGGNPLVRQHLARLYAHLHLFRLRRDTIVVEEALEEHRLIVAAVERRDCLIAEAAMRSHIDRSRQRILDTLD